ncbi:hypothetical protein BDQ17DRAFT_1336266 [Cyathus striatus]|nr:hypothetical protein BDQ17DRAFT_1336266 [Cyathus striatus]
MDVVEKENNNESTKSESSESGDEADAAMDVDITPKKAKPVLKHGHAPSSPKAKSSDTSSATSTASEISTDYLQGNTYNYGDEEEAPNTKGDIRLFFKSDTTDPDYVITDQQPLSDFHDVLETLGNIYLPVAKRNARISICENGYWSLKGKYLNISQKQKPLSANWRLNDQNKYFIDVLADGANIEQNSESTGPMVSKSSGPSESKEDIANAMMISHFNIPEHLLKKSSKEQDIQATYEKYVLIENIWNDHKPDLSTIEAASKSTIDKKQIISLLIAPSTYYSYAMRVFPLLHYSPEMTSWMKREEGRRDAVENEAGRREIESEDPESEEEVVKKNKGKGKQREDKGNIGKSKDDKEGKEKSKRSHKKDKGKSKQL